MLVLLHGFTGAPRSWARVRAMLDAPSLAPALPGHSGPDVVDFAGAVEAIARAVPAGATLVGYSLGARLALGVAVAHRARLAGLVLIGANPGLRTDAERVARRAADRKWIEMLETAGLEPFLAAWRAQPLFASQESAAPEDRALQAEVARSHDPQALARSLRATGLAEMPDYRPHLAELDLPVRLVTGALDAKFTKLAEEMQASLQNAEHVILEGCGHNPIVDRPRALADLLAPR